jgi:hypothetical protein
MGYPSFAFATCAVVGATDPYPVAGETPSTADAIAATTSAPTRDVISRLLPVRPGACHRRHWIVNETRAIGDSVVPEAIPKTFDRMSDRVGIPVVGEKSLFGAAAPRFVHVSIVL